MPKDIDTSVLTVSIGQWSSAGQKPVNQDFHGTLVPAGASLALKGITLAISDGISSSAVSHVAAETAIKSLLSDYYSTPDGWTVKTAASRVISATNSWLFAQNNRAGDDINRGMVCTLSALILKGRRGHVFHVGDSRIARLSGDTLEPLTTDHRVTLSAVESYLGRAMGAQPQVEIDYRAVDLRPGDIFVLTTDGVHDQVEPRQLARMLAGGNLDRAAQQIVDLALQSGSDDNLTVQIARIDSLPPETAPDLLDGIGTLPVPQPFKAGDLIDGFQIQRQIHGNARSYVYLALAPDGKRVALKIPSADLRADPAARQRFMMEDWIARRVASPHVMAAGPLSERTALYTVSEFIKGQSLRQWMTDHPRPSLEEVRGIVEQIVLGLRAFHRREMLHQDLRPENILIDDSGTVKIIDFGSVCVAGIDEIAPKDEILGTYQYTAPEYLSGDVVSWRADLFALGVIAYEMLTGRLPYGAHVARVRNPIDQRRLRYVTARSEHVPGWIDDALARAVHPDPRRRHNALSEFSAALRAPAGDYAMRRRVPLTARDPLRFWQGVSVLLALICLSLIAKLVL